MLSEKMQVVANTIEHVVEHTFTANYIDFICEGKLKMIDLVMQILVECSKNAYDSTSEKHSLRYYLRSYNMDDDSSRMMIKRTHDKIYTYRDAEYQLFKQRLSIDMPELQKMKMETTAQKLGGFQISEFQFWEICDVHDNRLIDAILSQRIWKKNITVANFIEYAHEFDAALNAHNPDDANDDSSYVFSFLAQFTLEWKYHYNFLYCIANELAAEHKSTIPISDRIIPFCSSLCNYKSPFFPNETVSAENRFVWARERFIPGIISMEQSKEQELALYRYVEAVSFIARLQSHMTYNRQPIRDWFISNTTVCDWASVFREYKAISSTIVPKRWTSKKVQLMKALYKTLCQHCTKETV